MSGALVPAATTGTLKSMTVLMPGECGIITIDFPEKRLTHLFIMSNLIHGFCVVKSTIDHDLIDESGILDIIQRIFIQYQKICQLTFFERTYIFTCTDIFGSVYSGSFQSFQFGHTALMQHPQLPVCSQTLKLSMRTHIDFDTRFCKR